MKSIALSLLLMLGPGPAHAKDAPEDCLKTRIWDTYGEGWAVRTSTQTTLRFGTTATFKVSLLKGRAYRFLTCGEEQIRNLDVLLYDRKGQVLLRDDSTGHTPQVAYTPEKSGLHYIVLYLRDVEDREAEVEVSWALVHNSP